MLRANTFEDLHRFLREFRNFRDPNGDYDFGGATHLMIALLENLKQYAQREELNEIGERFTAEQKLFLKQLASLLDSIPEK